MNTLIITTRQSTARQAIDYFATFLLWAAFAFFAVHFFIGLMNDYLWESEAKGRLQFYFLLAVANAIALILWALYNKIRFQKHQKTKAIRFTRQQLAKSLDISEDLYQKIQDSQKLHVHVNSHGTIQKVVSETSAKTL
ncbi:poly-beta-1,6-N-acetyl-D-glucosamine biosynthesis protein PgaD [Citrobacter sp. NCU1]|uniref:poly-beta-1,6-N-acetyl-D-glucosamine biosynthesis protein PgaD n=1 Tax=Citrobacter sp. NCU1 TaxID=2026683 RepID=UPI0013909B97|nr:poly-beta-1,6-N-acetyl-D-glucosamine biosynthesis protein PgaD [Citrobacter sp. NCU1]NDO81205.1 poly-beta-1,6-N-acetyl-D-glucosamine biosynthesis protein PgaD [Citrobacter sp. NCU1]